MNKKHKLKQMGRAALCTLAALSLAGCSAAKQEEPQTITIAAAASLENVFEDVIIPAYEKDHNVKITGVYDASGKLVTQIEQGLDADIFISAGQSQMDQLEEEGYISKDHTESLLENKLVLIVPAGSETITFEDLPNLDAIALGDPEFVPAGQYAKEILEYLGEWDAVSAKASWGTNVTEVLGWVAAGSAQAGIVYSSDAKSTDNVVICEEAKEEWLTTPVIYPAGVLNHGEDNEAVWEFYNTLKDEQNIEAFTDAGFTVVAP